MADTSKINYTLAQCSDAVRAYTFGGPQPFAHQLYALDQTYRKRFVALEIDPGLGKTKITIDTAALLFLRDHVEGLLVLAPNDVHAQWANEQIPLHLPATVPRHTVVWRSGSARVRKEMDIMLHSQLASPVLRVLCMNHEALATKAGFAAARAFLLKFPTLFVLDESHEFRTPSAARTKRALKLAPIAFARRILTGTLDGGTPFHWYSQFSFLHPYIFGDSYTDFRNRYGVFTKGFVRVRGPDGAPTGKLREFPELQGYRNIEDLRQRVAPYVVRVRKAQCADMPEKLFTTLPTHLSQNQVKLYNELLDSGLLLLNEYRDNKDLPPTVQPEDLDAEELLQRLGEKENRMTYSVKLTLLLRLLQVVGGFTTDDAGRTQCTEPIGTEIPRVTATVQQVMAWLRTSPTQKVIVWAVFRAELLYLQEQIKHALFADDDMKPTVSVRVDGSVTGDSRAEKIKAFKHDPRVRVLVAHPRTLGTGQNFSVATCALYYSRTHSLFQREQSIERIHRLDSTSEFVTLCDVVADDAPVDRDVLTALKAKRDLSNILRSDASVQQTIGRWRVTSNED